MFRQLPWLPLLALSALGLPAAAQFAPSNARTDVYVQRSALESTVKLRVSGASGSFYGVYVHVGGDTFDPRRAWLLYAGVLQSDGTDSLGFTVPTVNMDGLPMGTKFHVRALYLDDQLVPRAADSGSITLGLQLCERLDIDFAGDGTALLAGETALDQWADRGVLIEGLNANAAHPQKAIVFDSSLPTGNDPDLATPGSGTNNSEALGKLLIIAENDVDLDGDGYVDQPDDERDGGTLRFTFTSPVIVCGTTLIDVDDPDGAELRCFGPADELLEVVPVDPMEDNARQDYAFTAEAVSILEIEFAGSGGLASLDLIPCPATLDFDHNSYGRPYGLLAGQEVTSQFHALGVQIQATNNVPWHPHKAVLFDTGNPSIADPDLVTPGYGIGNTIPRGMALIIAENDIDADATPDIIDVPDDERHGGVIVLEYPLPVFFDRATVLDVEVPESSWFEAYDEGGNLLAVVPLAGLGDNSAETVEPLVGNVRRIELHLGGSGALADLVVCPDFDEEPPLQ